MRKTKKAYNIAPSVIELIDQLHTLFDSRGDRMTRGEVIGLAVLLLAAQEMDKVAPHNEMSYD